MRVHQQLMCLLALTSSVLVAGCSSFTGNVIPASGPDMETVYDGMHHPVANEKTAPSAVIVKQSGNTTIATIATYDGADSDDADDGSNDDDNMKTIRHQVSITPNYSSSSYSNAEFRKLPNPELHLYVFPHFAGSDQVPVPGYHTVFNAYERDHYALANERG